VILLAGVERPKISICATVYNNADRVSASLDSIIKQFPDFNKNFELVIVDNYSTDGTYEILEKYMQKYKNIHVYRTKCKRGKGRDIALRKSKGVYVFNVDLDTIYYPTLSKIIYQSIRRFKQKTDHNVITGVIRRDTLLKIGRYKDLNIFEDTELKARAIHNGITFLTVPVKIGENQLARDRFREERYANSYFKKIVRLILDIEDNIRGNGTSHLSEIRSKYFLANIAFKIIYLKVKLFREEIYRYSDKYENNRYIPINQKFISPRLFHIPKKYWIYSFFIRDDCMDYKKALIRNILQLQNIGFNKFTYINDFIILYTSATSKKILENEIKFYESLNII